MGGSRRALYALFVGLAALATYSAPAAAQRRQRATFAAVAEGTENVSATTPADGETCPAGTGTETVQFTGAPFRIRIEDTGPFLEMSGLSRQGEDGRQPFKVSGSVTRSENGAFTCRLEVPPDCGTRPFSGLSMWLQGSSLRREHITLLVDLHAEDPPDVFSSCPLVGGFPALFVTKPPQAHATAATLFDRHRRTLVLDAGSVTSTAEAGGTSHIEKSLKLTLSRL